MLRPEEGVYEQTQTTHRHSDFRKIWEEDYYYIDKTAYIRRLLDEGTHYFLSRPRHFGKSLFLETLKELFEGNKPLFAGLYIHDRWDWSVRHPVLRLSFGSGNFKELGYVEATLMEQLATAAPVRQAHLGGLLVLDWYADISSRDAVQAAGEFP